MNPRESVLTYAEQTREIVRNLAAVEVEVLHISINIGARGPAITIQVNGYEGMIRWLGYPDTIQAKASGDYPFDAVWYVGEGVRCLAVLRSEEMVALNDYWLRWRFVQREAPAVTPAEAQ